MLLTEEERIGIALEKSKSVIYEWDLTSDTIKWTGSIGEVIPSPNAEKIESGENFLKILHPEDAESFMQLQKTLIKEGGEFARAMRVVVGKNVISLNDTGTVMRGEDGKTATSLVGVLRRKRPYISFAPGINHTRYMDETEYVNSRFIHKLQDVFDECQRGKFNSVFMKTAINNLPQIMTWYSLDVADEVMNSLESQLKNLIRHDGFVSRISVDQVGILLRYYSQSEAEIIADKVLRLSQLYQHPKLEEAVHLHASIGIVEFPKYAPTVEDVLNRAYMALSNVKEKSSQRFESYQDTKQEHLHSKDEMQQYATLQNAFREKRTCLAFQPIIECGTGNIHAHECLLRIREEDGNIITAGPMIPIAEKMGMIEEVDCYALEHVVEELKRDKESVLSFNVSSLTTENDNWLKKCGKLMQDRSLAERVIVEITETAAQHDIRKTAYFVAALQEMGCKVALDDFGVGYTSFRQLKDLSVDHVKIDGSYVMHLKDKRENLIFIKTLLEFTKNYGLKTVAECVEDDVSAQLLIDLGVDYMQGYYFGKPELERNNLQAA